MNVSQVSTITANILAGSVLLAAALGAVSARATPIAYGPALTNPDVSITFDGIGNDNEVGATYAGLGVTFDGLFATSVFGSQFSGTDAPAAGNFQALTVDNPAPVIIHFATPVLTAQFYLVTDGYGTTITSLLLGQIVETVTAQNNRTDGHEYFGFQNSLFDTITILPNSQNHNTNPPGTLLLDNVQVVDAVAELPTPGSAGMLLTGLCALAMVGSRRRA